MKSRALTVMSVVALGLLPAAVAAQGTVTAPQCGSSLAAADQVVNVKINGSIYGVFTEGATTRVKFQVKGGFEWPGENVDARKDATALIGGYVYTLVTPRTEVYVNSRPANLAVLTQGMTVTASLRTNGSPVSGSCSFELLKVYVEGDAAPAAPKPAAEVKPPEQKPEIAPPAAHGFELGFFPRLWSLRGDLLGLERDGEKTIVNLDVRKLDNQAKRFNDEGRRLTRLDSYVVIGPKTVVTDENGERISAKELRIDDNIRVIGKFLKPEKWIVDETDEKVPTMVAKRVRVLDRD